MSLIHWLGVLGIVVIAISFIVDSLSQLLKKGGKKLFGALELVSVCASVVIFSIVNAHLIENMLVINILFICLIVLYVASLVVRFSYRSKR